MQPDDLTSPEATASGTLSASAAAAVGNSDKARSGRRRWERPKGLRLVAAGWLAIIVTACVLSPLLPLPEPDVFFGDVAEGPFSKGVLGTDQLGRDMLSRLLWGGRTSVFIAVSTTLLAAVLGTALGIVAGYFKGRLDWVIGGLADVVLAFPALIMLIVLVSVFGLSVRNLVLGLFFLGTPTFVRIARAHTLVVSQKEYVLAARGSGAGHRRIMVRHLLPSVVGPVAAYALTYAAVVFVAEGSLSFLGLGVPPPTPAWGSMIAAGRPWLDRGLHIVLIPSLTLIFTVLSLNFLGDRSGRSGREG